ncbi:MAG: diaminopimelate epimerase [Methanosarcinales archaeon]|nr:diaminopimelate epimerase [ANME-2 cluster archaeon]MDW7775155.1 diaminopimelate epimerase [Methanosarcinales archaeon]
MIQFTKLHGNGNDFILIDEYSQTVVADDSKADFAEKYCDRRFGIGGDGVLYISRSGPADIKMRLFQPDRSEAEMCGNGIRCLVRYALEKGYLTHGTATVETMAGILPVDVTGQGDGVLIKVNMGKPLFDRKDIPARGDGEFMNEIIEGMQVSVINTGVPHAVIFVDDLEGVDIDTIAPPIRYNTIFPKGTNVNFVHVADEGHVNIRTYERGVEGETLSCGTGSLASVVIAHHLGLTGSEVTVNTLGGILNITLEGGYAFMQGTARTVFTGNLV